jgi:hypothetical protein
MTHPAINTRRCQLDIGKFRNVGFRFLGHFPLFIT